MLDHLFLLGKYKTKTKRQTNKEGVESQANKKRMENERKKEAIITRLVYNLFQNPMKI